MEDFVLVLDEVEGVVVVLGGLEGVLLGGDSARGLLSRHPDLNNNDIGLNKFNRLLPYYSTFGFPMPIIILINSLQSFKYICVHYNFFNVRKTAACLPLEPLPPIPRCLQEIQLRGRAQLYLSPQRRGTHGTFTLIQVMENARKFADTHLWPRVIEENRKGTFDPKLMKLMGENGFLGCTLKEYDLPGLSYTSYGLINR